jgi:hypothetical protein
MPKHMVYLETPMRNAGSAEIKWNRFRPRLAGRHCEKSNDAGMELAAMADFALAHGRRVIWIGLRFGGPVTFVLSSNSKQPKISAKAF